MTGRAHNTNVKSLVTDLNGIPVILNDMNTFSNNEPLTLKACEVFKNICSVKALRQQILDSTALTALASPKPEMITRVTKILERR